MAKIIEKSERIKIHKQHPCLKHSAFGIIANYCPKCGEYLYDYEDELCKYCSSCDSRLTLFSDIEMKYCPVCGAWFE